VTKEWYCLIHKRIENDETIILDGDRYCSICAYDGYTQLVAEIKDG